MTMLDRDYLSYLLDHHETLLDGEVLEWQEAGNEIRRAIRYLPKPVIGAIGPKKVPPEWFAFVEHSVWDASRFELRFDNVPSSATVRKHLSNSGSIRLAENDGGDTERIAEGELKVNLPMLLRPLASIAERLIHSEAAKILDGEAKVLRQRLQNV